MTNEYTNKRNYVTLSHLSIVSNIKRHVHLPRKPGYHFYLPNLSILPTSEIHLKGILKN